jgi:hypothetical protein
MKVHYGVSCTVLYDWNGRLTFWGSRAGSVKARADRLSKDPRATNIRIRIAGKEYRPEDVEVTR